MRLRQSSARRDFGNFSDDGIFIHSRDVTADVIRAPQLFHARSTPKHDLRLVVHLHRGHAAQTYQNLQTTNCLFSRIWLSNVLFSSSVNYESSLWSWLDREKEEREGRARRKEDGGWRYKKELAGQLNVRESQARNIMAKISWLVICSSALNPDFWWEVYHAIIVCTYGILSRLSVGWSWCRGGATLAVHINDSATRRLTYIQPWN